MFDLKLCNKCNIEKEIYLFSRRKKMKDGLNSTCKRCLSIYNKNIYENMEKEEPKPKFCTSCNVLKNPSDFSKHKGNRDGLNSICKKCVNIIYSPREYRKEYRKKYYKENKEKVNKKTRENYLKNREKLIKKNQDLKKQVMNHYGGMCSCCGEDGVDFLNIDHINNDGNKHRKELKIESSTNMYGWLKKNNFPKDNFQVLCYNCNIAKSHYGYCPHQKSFHTNEV